VILAEGEGTFICNDRPEPIRVVCKMKVDECQTTSILLIGDKERDYWRKKTALELAPNAKY
jgi:hypothetical protein